MADSENQVETAPQVPPQGPVDGWTLSNERQFMEGLVNTRANFLVVFFGLIVAGSVAARDLPIVQTGILGVGVVIIEMLRQVVGRAQTKLKINLILLYKIPDHPTTIVNEIANLNDKETYKKRHVRLRKFGNSEHSGHQYDFVRDFLSLDFPGSRNNLTGLWIPQICKWALVVGFLFSLFNLFYHFSENTSVHSFTIEISNKAL